LTRDGSGIKEVGHCQLGWLHFYRAMLAQSAVMRLHVVRLSVTFRYRVQIGLKL